MDPTPEQVWAVVPAKGFHHAKSRLDAVLEPSERGDLARRMLGHVLDVLLAAPLAGVLVTTDAPIVLDFAADRGASTMTDRPSVPSADQGPLGAVVDAALQEVATLGATAALVVMADLPALELDDVLTLLDALDDAPLVLAPDRDGEGTNALAVRPPDLLDHTCFGRLGSFDDHRVLAARAGIDHAIVERRGLALDVDTPADLELIP